MKKKLDKLKIKINYDKKLVTFMIVLVLIGIITGTFFTLILNGNDKKLVIEYIESFVESISNNKLVFKDTLKNALISNMVYILSVWILGISIIGLPVIVLITFWKSFVIGFSISSFIITYGIKGCILSFIYMFPHFIINLLFFIILSTYAIRLSLKLVSTILNKKSLDFKLIINKYFNILLICTIIIILSVLYEVFIMPIMIKFIVSLLF